MGLRGCWVLAVDVAEAYDDDSWLRRNDSFIPMSHVAQWQAVMFAIHPLV
jgi:hypothetical protein